MNPRKQSMMAADLLLCALLVTAFEAGAQANFVEPASFVVLVPCQAVNSIRNRTGAVDLEVDKAYVAYGENKAVGGSHVHIGFGGSRKWVSLECGDYEGRRPDFMSRPEGGGGTPVQPSTECLSFFDALHNPVHVAVGGNADITPSAPPIEPFGHAVNAVCGAPGKQTTEAEFKQLMRDHPQVLADVMAYTGGKVFADRDALSDPAAYLEDLAEAWYAVSAFDHIFCGETKGSSKVGGLHYHGRYQQLQASGDACRLPNHPQNEVVDGSIYTMGVRMKRPSGGWAQSSYKGYGLTFSAADILKLATRALTENPTRSSDSTGCILAVNDGGTRYDMVFVRRARGIRTFYPDATPDFSEDPPCAGLLVLEEAGTQTGQPGPGGDVQAQSLTAGRFRIEVISVDDKGVVLRISEME
jgi:hypothetical protein